MRRNGERGRALSTSVANRRGHALDDTGSMSTHASQGWGVGVRFGRFRDVKVRAVKGGHRMDTREQMIQGRATELFRLCESHLIGLRTLLDVVHAAMERLAGQFRKEFHGFRLVLYLKS